MTCLDKNGKILAVGDVVSYGQHTMTISEIRPSISWDDGRYCVHFEPPITEHINNGNSFVYNIYLTKDTFMSDVRYALEGAQTHDAINPRKEN